MKKHVQMVLSIVVVIALAVGLFGLTSASAVKTEKEYTFYVVVHGGPATPWWAIFIKGMRDAAEEFNVEAIFAGPEKYSIAKLVDMLETAVAARPDGIAVTITAVEPLDEPLRRAIKLGIPVIAVGVRDPRPPEERIPYLFYIGTDQYLMGASLARRLLKEFTPKRAVVGIQEVGHIGLEARAKGFTDVLGEKGVPVERLDITPDIAKGTEIYRSYLKRHPDTDVICGVTMNSAPPALMALEEEGLLGKVKLVNTDISPTIIKAIKDGYMVATAEQQQYLQGYLGILFLKLYNKYGFVLAQDIITGPGIVDKTNVEFKEKTVALQVR